MRKLSTPYLVLLIVLCSITITTVLADTVTINTYPYQIPGSGNPGLNVASSGNVGIGTTTPNAKLSFGTPIGNKIFLYDGSLDTYGFGIQGALMQIFTGNSGSDIAFGWGDSNLFNEKMRIKGSGNIGIGTPSPAARLQVVTPNGGSLYVSDYGCGSYGGIGGNVTLTGCTNYALLTAGQDTFINRPSGYTIGFRENNGQEMTIASGGNVGIGTASPFQKLDVNGNIRLTGNIVSPNNICIGSC